VRPPPILYTRPCLTSFLIPQDTSAKYIFKKTLETAPSSSSSLFSLPTVSSPEGPLGQLPTPTTQLPRAKPLPKPKPPTKWEKFARAKGIQSQRRDRKVWDDESQTWVPRWGWKGRNKAEETQWLHEVPANAGTFFHNLI